MIGSIVQIYDVEAAGEQLEVMAYALFVLDHAASLVAAAAARLAPVPREHSIEHGRAHREQPAVRRDLIAAHAEHHATDYGEV